MGDETMSGQDEKNVLQTDRLENVWTIKDKEDAGTFFRQLLDHSTRYMTAGLRDAHRAANLSNEEFWRILFSQKPRENQAGYYPPLAGPAVQSKHQQYPDQDPYSLLDFQACNKYLYFGAQNNVVRPEGRITNDHRQDFYRYFGISNQENYRAILQESIRLRNLYSHNDEVSIEQVDPDDLAKSIENLRLQTDPLARRRSWCAGHPELESPDEYWMTKKQEYAQRFGAPPVDFYALAQEVLMTADDLTPRQEAELFQAMHKLGLFNIEGHLVRGVDEEMLRLVLRSTLTAPGAEVKITPELMEQAKQKQAERRRADEKKQQACKQALLAQKERSRQNLQQSVEASRQSTIPVSQRPWVMEGQSLMQLRSVSGRLLPTQAHIVDALVKNFTPMLDETILLTKEGLEFMERCLVPALKRVGRSAYVDESVVSALFRVLRSTGKGDRTENQQEAAMRREIHGDYKRAIKALSYACKEGCLQVSASPITSPHSYENIRWAAEFSDTVPFLVFTMDGNLAEELVQIPGKNAVALKVTREMELLIWKVCDPVYRQMLAGAQIGQPTAFSGGAGTGDHPMPRSGDTVLIQGPEGPSSLKLGKKLGEGGEGVIYEAGANSDQVAKIYHSSEDAARRHRKLEAMVQQNPRISGLCWPAATLHNTTGDFVGYLMPRAWGKELATTVFRPGRGCQRLSRDMGWTRRSLAKIAENIAAVFAQMHAKGILMGDVNPRNFLVTKDCKVYLVDCDSYQFGGYSCPVGTDLYTPPEVHTRIKAGAQKGFNYVRTEHNERYSLAVLLFEVIMLGKAPYVSRNNDAEDVVDAIIAGDFPYPFKDGTSGQNSRMAAPLGQWRDIWSHTTFKVKKQFYATFTKENDDRPSASDWRDTMAEYGYAIESGYSTDDLVPRGFKDISQSSDEDVTAMVQVECERCHTVFTMAKDRYESKKHRGEPILCSVDEGLRTVMRGMPKRILCSHCGKTFEGTALDWLEQQKGKKVYCPACEQVTLKCSRCGGTYKLDRDRAQALQKQGREPICPDCRGSRPTVQCEACGTEFRIWPEKLANLRASGRQVLCPQCLERMLRDR